MSPTDEKADEAKNRKKSAGASKNKSNPNPPKKSGAVKKKSAGRVPVKGKNTRKVSQGHAGDKSHTTESKTKDGKKKSGGGGGGGSPSEKDKKRKKSSGGKNLGNKSKGKEKDSDKKHAAADPNDPNSIRQKQKEKSGKTKREGSLLLSGGSSLTSSMSKFDPGLPKFEYISFDYEPRRNPCLVGSCTEASAAKICSIFAFGVHYSCLMGFITYLCILQAKGENIFGGSYIWFFCVCGPLSGLTALDCAVFYSSYTGRAGPRFAHMACIHWLVCAILSLMVVILFAIYGFAKMIEVQISSCFAWWVLHVWWIWIVYAYLRWIDNEILAHNIKPRRPPPQTHRTSHPDKEKKASMAHNREETERGGYSYAL